MKCPKCGCIFWHSFKKNDKNINIQVKCLKCGTVYNTRYA